MTPDDSDLKQSDDIVAPDAPDETEPEETDEGDKSKYESGWDNFPHTLQSLKDQDPVAWGAFVTRQNRVAENIILGSFSRGSNQINIQDAQDLAAELYIKLAENIVNFNTLDAVGKWFAKALKRDALDFIGRKMAAKHGAGKVDSLDVAKENKSNDQFSKAQEYTNDYHKLHDKNFDWEIGRQRDSAEEAILDEKRRGLELCVRQLKTNEQKLIQCEIRQMTHEEIAAECGCKTNEVGIKLKRIHTKLAKKLKELELKEDL